MSEENGIIIREMPTTNLNNSAIFLFKNRDPRLRIIYQ